MHLPRDNRFGVDLDGEGFVSSTKMVALMQHLERMGKGDKAVVFSQFLGMMDLIEHDLRRSHIRFVVIYIAYLENGRLYPAKVKSQDYI